MSTKQRNYRATFILDNRGTEDTIEKIIEDVKTEITAVQAKISAVENLGRRDFIRVTDKKLTAANYVQVDFSASAEVPALLKERLRLKHFVYRTFIASV
jgi:small subunit ribosomal protein S6